MPGRSDEFGAEEGDGEGVGGGEEIIDEPGGETFGEDDQRGVHGFSFFPEHLALALACWIICSRRSSSSGVTRRESRAWTRYSSTAPSKTLSRNPAASLRKVWFR